MKVRTPDGKVHDVRAPEAARLIHTSGAVPVVTKDEERRPDPEARVEKRG